MASQANPDRDQSISNPSGSSPSSDTTTTNDKSQDENQNDQQQQASSYFHGKPKPRRSPDQNLSNLSISTRHDPEPKPEQVSSSHSSSSSTSDYFKPKRSRSRSSKMSDSEDQPLSSPPQSPLGRRSSTATNSSQTSGLKSPGPSSSSSQAFIYPMRSAITVKRPGSGGGTNSTSGAGDGGSVSATSPRSVSGKHFPSSASAASSSSSGHRSGGNLGQNSGVGNASSNHNRALSSASSGVFPNPSSPTLSSKGGSSPKGAPLGRQSSSAGMTSRSISSMMDDSSQFSTSGAASASPNAEEALGLDTRPGEASASSDSQQGPIEMSSSTFQLPPLPRNEDSTPTSSSSSGPGTSSGLGKGDTPPSDSSTTTTTTKTTKTTNAKPVPNANPNPNQGPIPSHYDVNSNTGEITKQDLEESAAVYPAPTGDEAFKVDDLGSGSLPSYQASLTKFNPIRPTPVQRNTTATNTTATTSTSGEGNFSSRQLDSSSTSDRNSGIDVDSNPGRDSNENDDQSVLSTKERLHLESERSRLEAMTTTRFTHVQTEDGHMVVTGRDGKLARCEDEPIHIPGAVQSFGCMVVLREDEEGNLVVRQCSENSGEILGLPPSYLFSIPSFFDCLDEDQADALWDSVETLDENDQDLTEGGPHIFQLSGWGRPVDDQSSDLTAGGAGPEKRKKWSCWCAAHKPQSRVDTSGKRPLIVLEFEPVFDVAHPISTISPPGTPEETETELEAVPEDEQMESLNAHSLGSGSANTGSTAKNNVNNHNPYFSAAPTTSGAATSNDTDSQLGSSSAAQSLAQAALTPGGSVSQFRKKPKGGLEGEPYQPTAEEFAESTTVSSKPLKALARMRKERHSDRRGPSSKPKANAADAGDGGSSTSAPRNRRRRPNASGPELDENGFGTGPKGEKYDYGSADPFSGFGSNGNSGGSLDMFGVLSQANEQLSAQTDLQSFLKVVVGIIREMTRFSRVMVYQFDEAWNGQVVCELVDWNDTHDLYRGLHFPATDIPKQARDLYKINKVRLLYDRDEPTSRMVCREREDLETPIDMTHSFLRAMSPIHIKYLANMGVKASMSISITAFDQLWGLIALHGYGNHGRRVSFPIRQLCRLLGESVSRNIERLSYTQRLSSRKLINTLPSETNPSGYIISNAEDLLTLFDADYGVIAIGHEAKILGPLSASQEVLAVTEYLRIKRFTTVLTSQDVRGDFPDMVLHDGLGLDVVAGLMLIPLTDGGADFIAFLRKSQVRHVNWAGRPFKSGSEGAAVLEPRKSFKIWSETVVGTCRAWKDEELETASVLCLVYGKFISVWRQRGQAMHYNQLNRLLLSNASHEVRTPLNHIINYLELALDGQLDADTRENLSKSHMASKSLLFVINDLLDLTRQEQGRPLLLNEPFDLSATIREAVQMHGWEAKRRKIEFTVETSPESLMVIGDKNRIRQVVTNTVTNAVKYTEEGMIHVSMRKQRKSEHQGPLPAACSISVEIVVSDTGVGIPRDRLEALFREFEQVESVVSRRENDPLNPGGTSNTENAIPNDGSDQNSEAGIKEEGDSGLGLGLALVARIIKNLGGQLRVDSTVEQGSKFTFYVPFAVPSEEAEIGSYGSGSQSGGPRKGEGSAGGSESTKSEIDSLVEAISAPLLMGSDNAGPRRASSDHSSSRSIEAHAAPRALESGSGSGSGSTRMQAIKTRQRPTAQRRTSAGQHNVEGSAIPLRSVKVDPSSLDTAVRQAVRYDEIGASSKPALSPPISVESNRSGPAPIASPKGDSLSKARKRAAQKKAESSQASSSSEKLSPLRILVVEDDPINRMILKKRLGMDGHTVLLAVNGEEGVRQFEKDGTEMDLILMDLQMPICNGQDACKRIRSFEKARSEAKELADRPASHVLNGRIPIFAVSATLDERMRKEMVDIGMDGWILKPVDFNRLRTLMRGLTYVEQRESDRWVPGFNWEKGGWLSDPANRAM